jgi:DNA-nicking Smr family endonuclease
MKERKRKKQREEEAKRKAVERAKKLEEKARKQKRPVAKKQPQRGKKQTLSPQAKSSEINEGECCICFDRFEDMYFRELEPSGFLAVVGDGYMKIVLKIVY